MADQGFPLIEYELGMSPRQWGRAHGESMRDGIRELAAIRRRLMQERNPKLSSQWIERLAAEQWAHSQAYDSNLADELSGIAEGAGISVTDLVVLNNYTDFRDIEVPDQGCSVVYVNADGRRLAGQTWDMHRSAKDFVCVLRIPGRDTATSQLVFSVVGCVGMMGFNVRRFMVGVNNLNTSSARPGILWPMLIRRLLNQSDHAAMVRELTSAPVTSGHVYLLATDEGAEFWETMPGLAEKTRSLRADEIGQVFQTNHCLGTKVMAHEIAAALSSTTHKRYELLTGKVAGVKNVEQLYDLLNDHENYPMSICSHFQTNSQDPSFTCGGAAADLGDGRVFLWRGDALTDDHFKMRRFQI